MVKVSISHRQVQGPDPLTEMDFDRILLASREDGSGQSESTIRPVVCGACRENRWRFKVALAGGCKG